MTAPAVPSLASFQAAQTRVAPHVARTPLIRLSGCDAARGAPTLARAEKGVVDARQEGSRLRHDVWLKLESMQVTGSFKARGALNKILSLESGVAARGIVTASGGNHGLAVAYGGRVVGAPTIVYLPRHTSAEKAARIERWGATVVRAGEVWDDAHEAALAHAARENMTYVHPFADPAVVAGQGTIALELAVQAPEIDLLIVAIGGGGLVSGVASAARHVLPHARVVGVEPVGAPTLTESLRTNAIIELPEITTAAGTLAPRRSDAYNLDIIQRTVDGIVLVTDDEMRDGARWLLAELGVGAELSGAAAVAALLAGKVDLRGAQNPCALVCGAGKDAGSHRN